MQGVLPSCGSNLCVLLLKLLVDDLLGPLHLNRHLQVLLTLTLCLRPNAEWWHDKGAQCIPKQACSEARSSSHFSARLACSGVRLEISHELFHLVTRLVRGSSEGRTINSYTAIL